MVLKLAYNGNHLRDFKKQKHIDSQVLIKAGFNWSGAQVDMDV